MGALPRQSRLGFAAQAIMQALAGRITRARAPSFVGQISGVDAGSIVCAHLEDACLTRAVFDFEQAVVALIVVRDVARQTVYSVAAETARDADRATYASPAGVYSVIKVLVHGRIASSARLLS